LDQDLVRAPLVFRPQLFLRGLRLLFGDHAMFFRRTDFLAVGRQSIITCLTFRESMRDRDHTVGSYLAARLTQIGLNHNFAMRVTSTSPCSTSFWTNKDLEQIYCCNELNCGYSPLSQG
jgi:hypothetical protein